MPLSARYTLRGKPGDCSLASTRPGHISQLRRPCIGIGNTAKRSPCCQTSALLAETVQHPTSVRGTDVLPRLATPDDNRQIRLAARWQDIDKFVSEQPDLSPGAAAYALYRLGCLFTYMSWQRKEELERSGLVEALVDRAAASVDGFGASEVTLALDGLARLKHQPSTTLLDALAQRACENARSLQASQIPLILRALAMLNYNPVVAVLGALDQQIERLSAQITAQGISLVLSAYQSWRYHPEGTTLAALSSAIRHRISSFKPSELAGALEALSALGFHPGNDVVQAVAQRVGVAITPAILASPVVNHRALDAVTADYHRAAADAINRSTESVAAHALYAAARQSAQETAAAVTEKGRAAAEGVKRKAKTALEGVRSGLVKAPEGFDATVEDWLFEFGQWQGARTPTLCAAVARPPQMSCSRWPMGRGRQQRGTLNGFVQ